jgi:hypothetical protein
MINASRLLCLAAGIPLAASAMGTPASAGLYSSEGANSSLIAAGERLLGGVDMQGYCMSRGYVRADLQGNTAYDWRCVTGSGGRDHISMTDACRWQYSRTDVIDRVGDFYNPYSWQCWGD